MASFQYSKLITMTPVATAAATAIFTNAVSSTTFINTILICNASGTARTFYLYNVPNSSGSLGTPSVTNLALKMTLAVDETIIMQFPSPIVLDSTNDAIFALTDANYVNVQMYGNKYS